MSHSRHSHNYQHLGTFEAARYLLPDYTEELNIKLGKDGIETYLPHMSDQTTWDKYKEQIAREIAECIEHPGQIGAYGRVARFKLQKRNAEKIDKFIQNGNLQLLWLSEQLVQKDYPDYLPTLHLLEANNQAKEEKNSPAEVLRDLRTSPELQDLLNTIYQLTEQNAVTFTLHVHVARIHQEIASSRDFTSLTEELFARSLDYTKQLDSIGSNLIAFIPDGYALYQVRKQLLENAVKLNEIYDAFKYQKLSPLESAYFRLQKSNLSAVTDELYQAYTVAREKVGLNTVFCIAAVAALTAIAITGVGAIALGVVSASIGVVAGVARLYVSHQNKKKLSMFKEITANEVSVSINHSDISKSSKSDKGVDSTAIVKRLSEHRKSVPAEINDPLTPGSEVQMVQPKGAAASLSKLLAPKGSNGAQEDILVPESSQTRRISGT